MQRKTFDWGEIYVLHTNERQDMRLWVIYPRQKTTLQRPMGHHVVWHTLTEVCWIGGDSLAEVKTQVPLRAACKKMATEWHAFYNPSFHSFSLFVDIRESIIGPQSVIERDANVQHHSFPPDLETKLMHPQVPFGSML